MIKYLSELVYTSEKELLNRIKDSVLILCNSCDTINLQQMGKCVLCQKTLK